MSEEKYKKDATPAEVAEQLRRIAHDVSFTKGVILNQAALLLESPFQPIETAPRDEELLLTWFYPLEKKWIYQVSLAYATRGGWRHGRATHWMPLLEPPKQKE